jgi:hypothetical protein
LGDLTFEGQWGAQYLQVALPSEVVSVSDPDDHGWIPPTAPLPGAWTTDPAWRLAKDYKRKEPSTKSCCCNDAEC